jgi:hypothetical protein
MVLIATALQDGAAAAAPAQETSEVPELASMALLSVVLAGISLAVRRIGTKSRRNGEPPREGP